MSKKRKFLIAFLAFLIISIGLLSIDDKLSPDVISMYKQATAYKESEAYTYLYGIDAAAVEDPMVVGKAIIESIRIADKEYLESLNVDDYEYDEYPENKRISRFKLDACESDGSECDYVDQLFNHTFDNNKLNDNDKVLLERFNTFLLKDDLHTIITPHLLTPFPPYTYFLSGNDLNNLSAIQFSKDGHIEKATELIGNNITQLRKQLKNADNLISKMIFSVALSKNIDLYSVLLKQDISLKKSIKSLTLEERSLEKVMNYELGFTYNTSKLISNDHQTFVTDDDSLSRYIPSWLFYLFYKPNMTMNSYVPIYKQIANYSHLSSEEYSKKLEENNSVQENSYIRNLIGTILSQVSSPEFTQYISRVFAIDAKIKLFNETQGTIDSINPETIKNPFYSDGTSAYFSDNKKAICFDIPLIKRDQDRCLILRN